MKSFLSNATIVHCFIHTFALCAKALPEKMLLRLKRVIKLANFVKTSAVNTRLFKRLCEDFSSNPTCLLNYTKVRWLSRGNATRHLFKLRYKLLQFFREKIYDFQANLESKEFVARLAYLSDIFEVLSNFDMSFQGTNGTLPKYISKLALWMENVKNKKYAVFKFFTSVENKPNDEFSEEIVCSFSQLKKELMHYFPEVTSCAYYINPFLVDSADLPVRTGKEEELIDIQTDETAKIKHKKCGCLINIWLSMESLYPNLATHAVPQLLIFPSRWECEQGFSALMSIKSKRWNRFAAPGDDFRCTVSKVIPRIGQLVGKSNYILFIRAVIVFSVIF